ncbi:hypothetical protein ECZU29_60730 [Escherichia coli]|nr:hypothetical protein ECZU29_60730 [Escherichia coli]
MPASELAAANKQIRELQRLLGKKTMEAEILKEAVEFGRAKMDCACALVAGTTNKRRLQKSWRVACAVEHSGSPAI